MLWFYRLIFLPGLILIFPGYLRRAMRRGGLRERLGDRFGTVKGLPPRRPGVRRIWLQAVSVGELLAMAPFLESWKLDPSIEVYLTTTTTTGYAIARERFLSLVIGLGYFPIDFWPMSARAWRRIEPDLAIVAEGERWPEHIHQAHARGVPIICVNARISNRSFRRTLRLRWLAIRLWGGLDRILASSTTDAERFRQLGFTDNVVRTTGSIKLDLAIERMAPERRQALRRELGLGDRLVILGASTWPGEETALVEVLRTARSRGIDCALLLVPRHAERRGEINRELSGNGFSSHFRTSGPVSDPVDICVGDTTGELRGFVELADVVFVGRSLPPHHAGQTPIEAAVLGKPILFGPDMTNFRDIAAGLARSGAAHVVHNEEELTSAACELLADSGAREQMAREACRWCAASRGAVERTHAAIRELLATKQKH